MTLNLQELAVFVLLIFVLLVSVRRLVGDSAKPTNPDVERERLKQVAWTKLYGGYTLSSEERASLNLSDEEFGELSKRYNPVPFREDTSDE